MSTGRWFRFYDSVIDDPKVQRLPDAAFRAWVNLMCLASKNGGKISTDLNDVAFSLRLPVGKVRDLIQVLQSSALIERFETGYEPHNWNARQYKSDVSTDRVKRFRKRSAKQDANVPETTPDTDSDTETDSESGRKGARAEALLSRICEILRIRLLDDPSRLAWPRQVEEMLRDGLDETEIIRATEVARTNGKLSLAYIRAVALKPQKEPENDGRNGPDPHRPHQRDIARDNAAEHALAAIRGRSDRDSAGGSGQSAGRREPETVVIEARPASNAGADHRPSPNDGNYLPAPVPERAREVGKIPDFLRRPQPKANPGTGLSMEAIPNERREILPDTGADFGPVQVRG